MEEQWKSGKSKRKRRVPKQIINGPCRPPQSDVELWIEHQTVFHNGAESGVRGEIDGWPGDAGPGRPAQRAAGNP